MTAGRKRSKASKKGWAKRRQKQASTRVKNLKGVMKRGLAAHHNGGGNPAYERFRDAKRELYAMVGDERAQEILDILIEYEWGDDARVREFSKLS